MKELIIANWKMNPRTEKEAVRLAKETEKKTRGLKNAEVVIAPPFVFLEAVGKILKPITYNLKPKLGAQDIFWKEKGAYTGEVSSQELKSLGVKYVIVGHSERRLAGETDTEISWKVAAGLKAGLRVVLCVGEPWSVRKRGLAAAKRFVENQFQKDLKGIKNYKLKTKNLIIAYEPVWAIGTGRADKPKDAVEMARFIKKSLVVSHKSKVRVLYGGSVNSKNARAFLSPKEIDGALVGKASLKAGEFGRIVRTAFLVTNLSDDRQIG